MAHRMVYYYYHIVLEYCDFFCFKITFIPLKYLGSKVTNICLVKYNICLVKYILELHLELEIKFHYENPTFEHFLFEFSHRISIKNSQSSVTDGEIYNSKRQ